MRKCFLLGTLSLMLLVGTKTSAQDFSNKGKEFWLAYCYHVGMLGGGAPVMTIYLTSDVNTTFNVEIYGAAPIASGNITAGQVVQVIIPNAYFINDEGTFINRAIRVTAVNPIVVYSYITRSAASGATLCLPTNVLGVEYFAMSFTQLSNENNSNSYITIIAVEDNTTVEITPSGNTKNGWLANNTYTVTLNQGQVYQVLGTTSGFNGVDLTGSKVKSISSAGGGCKRIAVFSGSGKIRIPASGCSNNSSDNLYQQLYPTGTWGKRYLTAPSANKPNNYYRIAKNDPAANVYVNGVLIPAASFTNNYYQFFNNSPNLIESDLPISVAHYFTTQDCDGNFGAYDPEMIMLNPVEQNIDKVTLVSSNLVATTNRQHHLQVVMKNGGTALTSFRLDGAPVSAIGWIVHPADPSYSYTYFTNVTQGYHTLSSDTGFNALAYGYADFESYGYSAGSNIKDLYQFVSVSNQFATVAFPAACKGAPFSLSMSFPYQPTQIIWQFNGLFTDVTINSPVFNSSSVINGRTVYKYDLPGSYTIPTIGTYPIKVVAQNPTGGGCSGEQEIDYDLQVFNLPVADFNFTTNGCVSSPVTFTDNSTTNGRPIIHWHWDFGDNTVANDVTTTSHTYAAAGSYPVRYTVITDVGCKADTIPKTVVLSDPPVAQFNPVAPYCAGKTITFSDQSTVATGSITKWHWNFGDGPTTIFTSGTQSHTYAAAGTFNVTLQVESAGGCFSTLISKPVTVSPNPVVNFNLPSVCLPTGAAQFNSTSSISDGSQSLFTYLWNFGDASPTAGGQNPLHNYAATGPFNVSLTVTSNNGCATSLNQNLATIYAEPQAAFTPPAEVCLGAAVNFTDQSTAPGSAITQWLWNFGDATTSTAKNPTKNYTAPGTYTVTLSVTSAVGCQTVSAPNIATHTVIVNALPVADFNVSLPGCAGQGVTFTNASIANGGSIIKWTWNYGDATSAVLTSGNPFVHTYANVNSYNTTLQVETDKGCISTLFPRTVVINQVPVAGFISPEICVNDILAPFADTSKITGSSVTGWDWNFGDLNANAGNPNTSTLQNPTHHYTLPGPYNVQLIATSAAGCKDTISNPVIVNGGILTPAFTIQNTTALCSNKSITLSDASTIDAGNILRLEIYWDPTDLTIRTVDDDPTAGETYTHTYPEFGSPATRTYPVRYVVYSGLTCSNTLVQDIIMLATPQLVFNAALPVCSNAPAFQLAVQLQNGLPGSGVFTGTGVSSTGSFDPAIAGAGQHDIIYTYTGTNGCVNSVNPKIIVDPTPVADAGPDRVVLEGGFVVLTPKLITNIPVTYAWTPVNFLNNPAISNAQASPPTDFWYTLTVTSDKGCTDNDSLFVKLLKELLIPNIFSPNGDGIHDKWVIPYLESYPGCVVQIYNRYGQMIQKFVNYTVPWDGKITGQDAPVGTYYYIIDPKNGRKPLTGFVDIIR